MRKWGGVGEVGRRTSSDLNEENKRKLRFYGGFQQHQGGWVGGCRGCQGRIWKGVLELCEVGYGGIQVGSVRGMGEFKGGLEGFGV